MTRARAEDHYRSARGTERAPLAEPGRLPVTRFATRERHAQRDVTLHSALANTREAREVRTLATWQHARRPPDRDAGAGRDIVFQSLRVPHAGEARI
jgi:hypothetical protein